MIAGFFSGQRDYSAQGGPLLQADGLDAMLLAYENNQAFAWAKRGTGGYSDQAQSLEVFPGNGEIIAGGFYVSSFSVDSIKLADNGPQSNIWLGKMTACDPAFSSSIPSAKAIPPPSRRPSTKAVASFRKAVGMCFLSMSEPAKSIFRPACPAAPMTLNTGSTMAVRRHSNQYSPALGPAMAGNDIYLCEEDSSILNATPPLNGTGSWSLSGGAGSLNTPTIRSARSMASASGTTILSGPYREPMPRCPRYGSPATRFLPTPAQRWF